MKKQIKIIIHNYGTIKIVNAPNEKAPNKNSPKILGENGSINDDMWDEMESEKSQPFHDDSKKAWCDDLVDYCGNCGERSSVGEACDCQNLCDTCDNILSIDGKCKECDFDNSYCGNCGEKWNEEGNCNNCEWCQDCDELIEYCECEWYDEDCQKCGCCLTEDEKEYCNECRCQCGNVLENHMEEVCSMCQAGL